MTTTSWENEFCDPVASIPMINDTPQIEKYPL